MDQASFNCTKLLLYKNQSSFEWIIYIVIWFLKHMITCEHSEDSAEGEIIWCQTAVGCQDNLDIPLQLSNEANESNNSTVLKLWLCVCVVTEPAEFLMICWELSSHRLGVVWPALSSCCQRLSTYTRTHCTFAGQQHDCVSFLQKQKKNKKNKNCCRNPSAVCIYSTWQHVT